MSIQIRNVSKRFGTFVALDDVSFDIPSGELVALLGPSGSGKTTLPRLIAGLEDLNSGEGSIRYYEEDVAGVPVRKRRVGFVFQHYALFRHMSVFENIAFGLRAMPRSKRPPRTQVRARVHELLNLVQMDGLAGRYPSQLSGGQRQRVALARALAVQPRVLLLDEPFGALDAGVRAELRQWIRRLHDELQITSVFVTHDQEEAMEIADRVVVLSRGRIEQIGPPGEVYHSPQTDFVMNFLGQVNTFEALASDGAVEFAGIRLPAPDPAVRRGPTRVFVRPHELDVLPTSVERPNFAATVLRIRTAASVARLDLQLAGGEVVTAELSQEGTSRLAPACGSRVFVAPRRVHLFHEDGNRLSVV